MTVDNTTTLLVMRKFLNMNVLFEFLNQYCAEAKDSESGTAPARNVDVFSYISHRLPVEMWHLGLQVYSGTDEKSDD